MLRRCSGKSEKKFFEIVIAVAQPFLKWLTFKRRQIIPKIQHISMSVHELLGPIKYGVGTTRNVSIDVYMILIQFFYHRSCCITEQGRCPKYEF